MLGTLNDSTILRLRVKGSDLDPLALRGRLENLLSEVSLEPRLPPSATLFIRKLSDPLPGSIQLDNPHARAPQAWRHAFQTRFDQLVSSAARPAHGLVSDSAESVVFYDYAELLASLTADWCSGFATTRWWWQALIKRGDVGQMIRQFWREKVEYVPVALEFLARRNLVVEFVRELSDGEAREIVQRVIHVFGLTRILWIKATDFFPLDVAPEVAHVARARSEMPWRHVAPESASPQLRPVQQLFVGVVLMVHRAPARVRTASFAREVEQWIESVERVVEVPRVRKTVVVEEMSKSETEVFDSSAPLAPISVNQMDAAPEVVTFISPAAEKSVRSVAKIGNAIFSYEELAPLEAPIEAITVAVAPAIQTDPIIETSSPETIVPVSASQPLDAVTIETELGGLFYLINLAIFLEIYSDFTSPVEQFHDDLSIWDFVAIVGDHINEHRDLDDPIWTGLQDLQDEQDTEHEPTWLVEMLPDLRARLILALGIDDDANLANLLLHHYARVTITPTHLDVFFSLADHPIEIRLAGLDRDPGWVPAAGRFMAFHYD